MVRTNSTRRGHQSRSLQHVHLSEFDDDNHRDTLHGGIQGVTSGHADSIGAQKQKEMLMCSPAQGTFFVLIGTTIAAVAAFSFSRGIGQQLAARVVQKELGEDAAAAPSEDILSRFQGLKEAVEQGNPWQQFTAIVFLRLTPVVPFRCVNSPSPLLPYSPLLALRGLADSASAPA